MLASRFDESAARLAARWRARGARLLTPEGLSVRGWCHESDAQHRSVAVIDGELVPVRSIEGVLTRLSAVSEEELPHIVVEERAYVSSEMTAFLLAWLSSLECPVLNRPTATSLSGPSWSQEKWAREAAGAGLPIRPVRRVARRFAAAGAVDASPECLQPAHGELHHVTVVAGRSFGSEVGEETKERARKVAEAANVELLTATFLCDGASAAFVGGSPWVDVDRPEVADAILERWEAEQ